MGCLKGVHVCGECRAIGYGTKFCSYEMYAYICNSQTCEKLRCHLDREILFKKYVFVTHFYLKLK